MPMESVTDREFSEYLEKEVVVLIKDEHYLYGVFKSYDQYNSITLNYVLERIFHQDSYAEQRLGLMVIRGESIVLIATGTPPQINLKKGDFNDLLIQKEIATAKLEAKGKY